MSYLHVIGLRIVRESDSVFLFYFVFTPAEFKEGWILIVDLGNGTYGFSFGGENSFAPNTQERKINSSFSCSYKIKKKYICI